MHTPRVLSLSARPAWLIAGALALSVSWSPRAASAQSEALVAARRELLDRATAAARAGNHAQAIELAQRGGRIQMSLSVRMFLAEEHTAMGNHAAAYGAATACLTDATRDASAPNRETITERCRAIASSARARIVALTVSPPAAAPAGLAVRVNGAALGAEFYGLPYFVNQGFLVVEATAPNHRPFRWQGEGGGGGDATVALEMTADGSAPEPPAAVAPTTPARPVRPRRPRERPRGVNGTAVALMVAGGALEVAAAAFAGLYWTAEGNCVRVGRNESELLCPTDGDTQRAERMGAWTGLGWSTFAAGLISAGAGLGWMLATRAPSEQPSVEVDVTASGGATGVVVRGRF